MKLKKNSQGRLDDLDVCRTGRAMYMLQNRRMLNCCHKRVLVDKRLKCSMHQDVLSSWN